jgi:hypothetical protein
MRRKLGLGTALLAAVALAVLTFGSPLASGTDRGGRTFQLKAHEEFTYLDLGAPDVSQGDEFVFSDTLSRDDTPVGEDGGSCTVTHVDTATNNIMTNCVATLSLRGGQITIHGLVTFPAPPVTHPFTVAITGGTGAFRSVGGEMDVHPVSETDSIYTLHLDFE